MDRRRQWSLIEYRHVERAPALDLYTWEDEPERRHALRRASGLEEQVDALATDWERALRLMDWVHHLSAHQGWDEASDLSGMALLEGARAGTVTFRCVEFAHMLQQILAAFGFPARVVGLRRPHSEDGISKGHVIVDVWSGDHAKWVALDPQFNQYYRSPSGAVLSALEIHQRVRRGAFADLLMSREEALREEYVPQRAKDHADYATLEVPDGFERGEVWESLPDHADFPGFVRFWEEYFHYVVYSRYYSLERPKAGPGVAVPPSLLFHPKGDLPPVLFQRLASHDQYTSDKGKVSFAVNGVEVQWAPVAVAETAPIAETRRLTIQLTHSMPWFHHYAVTFNGTSWVTADARFEVQLKEGENALAVVPVNDQNRLGTEALVRLLVR